jgi:hypothetical protein
MFYTGMDKIELNQYNVTKIKRQQLQVTIKLSWTNKG